MFQDQKLPSADSLVHLYLPVRFLSIKTNSQTLPQRLLQQAVVCPVSIFLDPVDPAALIKLVRRLKPLNYRGRRREYAALSLDSISDNLLRLRRPPLVPTRPDFAFCLAHRYSHELRQRLRRYGRLPTVPTFSLQAVLDLNAPSLSTDPTFVKISHLPVRPQVLMKLPFLLTAKVTENCRRILTVLALEPLSEDVDMGCLIRPSSLTGKRCLHHYIR